MQGVEGPTPSAIRPVAAALGQRKRFREWTRGLRSQGLRVLWTEDLARLTAIIREEVVLLLVIDEDIQVSAQRLLDLLPAEAAPIPVVYLSDHVEERLRLDRLNEGLALSVSLETPVAAIEPALRALVGRAARQRSEQRLADELLRRATSSERALDHDRRRLSELRDDLQSLARGAENILSALASIDEASLIDRVLAERLRVLASNIVERTTSITGDLTPSHRIPRVPSPRRNGRRALRLEALAEEVVALYADSAEASGVRIELLAGSGLPEIWAERSRVSQLLISFLAHAVRYSPEQGRIRVSVEARQEQDDAWVSCRVEDRGPSLSSGEIERLFDEAFESGARSGAGLGFARQVAEEHRGRVTASIPEGGGLALTVVLPVDARKHRAEPTIAWAKNELVVAKLVAELRRHGIPESTVELDLDALIGKVLAGGSLVVHGEPD